MDLSQRHLKYSKVSFIRYSPLRIIRSYVFFQFPGGNTIQFLTYSLIQYVLFFYTFFFLVLFEKRINETLLNTACYEQGNYFSSNVLDLIFRIREVGIWR